MFFHRSVASEFVADSVVLVICGCHVSLLVIVLNAIVVGKWFKVKFATQQVLSVENSCLLFVKCENCYDLLAASAR
jgi:putative Ca2+/H+ antiporter (TMEM165/GDT1 family)